ncbi:LysR family transcriptional regulator [Consotaella salsifontis]|nr:LysR family transcriptional regulator [Consotaella salsifontis]
MKRNAAAFAAEHRSLSKPAPIRSKSFNWDDLKYFLAVCDTGSLRGAAEHLGVSTNVVRRKIEALETELSTALLLRSVRGVEMTPDGRSVYSVAAEIQQHVGFLDHFAARKSSAAKGLVRLSVTEGLGAFWVAPRVNDLIARYPKLRLDLKCGMRVPDVSRLECDVSIQLEEPQDPRLIVRRIATLHIMVFASEEYIRLHGLPGTLDDLKSHRLVHLMADQLPKAVLDGCESSGQPLKLAQVIVNTSSSQAMMIAEGVGVGALPTYAAALRDHLLPVATDLPMSVPLWLAYHSDSAGLRRVRAVVDWLVDVFDPNAHPWFREEFVPPHEFRSELEKSPTSQKVIWRRSPK